MGSLVWYALDRHLHTLTFMTSYRSCIAALLTIGLGAVVLPTACAPGDTGSLGSDVKESSTCRVPRVMFVVDASASMLDDIQDGMTSTTKWAALTNAVHTVLGEHAVGAQYGLMAFPGEEEGCAPGEVIVDIGLRNRDKIDTELSRLVIADDAATPAGQTLMAAALNEKLTDPEYDNYVIFISDGWQYCNVPGSSGAPECSLPGDCELMGFESEQCQSCNSCQIDSIDLECSGLNADGCYCVRNWPVLGVEALKAMGVKTFVVGFGDKVDGLTLNRAAVAGGDPLPNCNPDSESPSCFLQATSAKQLTDTLGKIMVRLTEEPCKGKCGVKGTRKCTLEGWTECKVPKGSQTQCTTSSSSGAGGRDGSSTGTTTGSSSSSGTTSSGPSSSSSGTTSSGTSSSSSGSGASSGEGGYGEGGSRDVGAGGSGNSSYDDDPWNDDTTDDGDDWEDDVYEEEEETSAGTGPTAPEAEGGCSYAANDTSSSDNAYGALALLGLVLAARRRRRS
jgi:MYXO-CTERM domain-containing protein